MPNQFADWLFQPSNAAGGVWAWPVLSVEPPGTQQITQQPSSTGLSGVPLVIQPIILLLTVFGLTDLLFVGSVTATITAGPASIIAGATALVVAGIATFVGLTLSGAGTSTITFSATGHTSVSAQVTIT